MWHGLFTCVTWLIHICDMACSYVTWPVHVWHESFVYDTALLSTGATRRGLFICVTWFVCDMTHSYVIWLIPVWYDSFICDTTLLSAGATWRGLFMCDMIHLWHDSPTCDIIIHMWHDSFVCDLDHSYVTQPFSLQVLRDVACSYVTWLICNITQSHVTWLIHTWPGSFIFKTTILSGGTMWRGLFICDITHI